MIVSVNAKPKIISLRVTVSYANRKKEQQQHEEDEQNDNK